MESSKDRRTEDLFNKISQNLDRASTIECASTTMYRLFVAARWGILLFSISGGSDAALARRRTELAWSGGTCAAASATGVASQKTFRAGIAIARSWPRAFSRARPD